jgi:hypothetical protein
LSVEGAAEQSGQLIASARGAVTAYLTIGAYYAAGPTSGASLHWDNVVFDFE